MVLIAWALQAVEAPFIVASLLLTAWVFITGALHLDGLADATDAAFAAHKDIPRTLEVFKDPHAGSMASVSIGLALILKFSALLSLVEAGQGVFIGLIVATTYSRLLAVLFMATSPYVSVQGMASGIELKQFRPAIVMLSLVILVLSLAYLPLLTIVALLVVLGLWCYLWRRFWLKCIKGYTGDCVGALIEVAEILTLLVIVLTRA